MSLLPSGILILFGGLALTFWPISSMLEALWNLELGRALLFLFLSFIVFSASMIGATIYGRDPREFRAWDRQWYCLKCGNLFFDSAELAADARDRDSPASGFVSPVVRSTRSTPREDYRQRVLDPIQHAARMTSRDLAGLNAIRERAAVDGSFDPERIGCDLGVISRLSSLEAIAYDKERDRFFVREWSVEVAFLDREGPRRGWWQRTFG